MEEEGETARQEGRRWASQYKQWDKAAEEETQRYLRPQERLGALRVGKGREVERQRER